MGDPDNRTVCRVPKPAPAPGAGLAAMKAYRDHLKAACRLLEARAVERCITLLQAPKKVSKTPAATRMDAHGAKLPNLDSLQIER